MKETSSQPQNIDEVNSHLQNMNQLIIVGKIKDKDIENLYVNYKMKQFDMRNVYSRMNRSELIDGYKRDYKKYVDEGKRENLIREMIRVYTLNPKFKTTFTPHSLASGKKSRRGRKSQRGHKSRRR